MLQRLLILSTLILISYYSFGQGGPRVSLKGGVNYTMLNNANWKSDPGVDVVPGIGFMGGVALGYNMNAYNFGFTVGGFLKQYRQVNTTSASILGQNFKNKADMTLTYVEVPILFRLRPAGNKMTRMITYGGPYFEIGVAPAFLNSAKADLETTVPIFGTIKQPGSDISNRFESMMWSGIIGFGFHQIGLEKWAVTHGFRLSYGLSDITGTNGGKDQDYIKSDGTTTSYEPTKVIAIGYVLTFSYKWSNWH
jgi:hypothetical protein